MYALQRVLIKNTIPLEEAKTHYKNITKHKPRKVRETRNWWAFRHLPPTKFEPKSFRTKVVNDDIHLLFGKLKPEHTKLEGRGLWDYFKKGYDYVANKASEAFDYIKKSVSVEDYSDATKKYLQQYGNLPVLAIQLRRVPVDITIELGLQGLSQGKWLELKKKYGFDEFYHLSMVATLGGAVERKTRGGRTIKAPKKLAIEKLAVVSINEDVEPKPNMETLDVPITHPFTINDMFNKARQAVGDTRFFSYSALGNNNCQNFIRMLLEAEGLYDEKEQAFVFQDISQLVKELPDSTVGISQGITHLAALANKYLGVGSGKKTHRENVLERYKLEDKSHSLEELSKVSSIPLEILQEVYNRGIGAHSTQNKSVRLKGSFVKNVDAPKSKKLSKEQWGYARVYSFLDGNPSHDNDLRENKKDSNNKEMKGGKKVSLDDLMKDEEIGGNKASGFIRAMMAKDTGNTKSEVWNAMTAKEKREANKKKFDGNDKMDVRALTKTTHDLLDTQKTLTRNEAIKRFYDYVKANAPQHEPHRVGDTNYVGTYDLDDLYERWKATEGVEVRQARRGKVQDNVRNEELINRLFEDEKEEKKEAPRARPVVRRPIRAVVEEVPEPPSHDRLWAFVRDNGVDELKRRLRGKTAEELIAFYRRGGGAIREKLRDVATAVGATHRRPPNARGVGAITTDGVAQNIVEKVRE